jgi:hypothetical protein
MAAVELEPVRGGWRGGQANRGLSELAGNQITAILQRWQA